MEEIRQAVGEDPPGPLAPRSMPGKPWQEVAVDFKGPIGGSKGYYFHV